MGDPLITGLREIQELHYLESRIVIGLANDHCGKCREDWPCATRQLADKALGEQ